jgi:hypothetical protein
MARDSEDNENCVAHHVRMRMLKKEAISRSGQATSGLEQAKREIQLGNRQSCTPPKASMIAVSSKSLAKPRETFFAATDCPSNYEV